MVAPKDITCTSGEQQNEYKHALTLGSTNISPAISNVKPSGSAMKIKKIIFKLKRYKKKTIAHFKEYSALSHTHTHIHTNGLE